MQNEVMADRAALTVDEKSLVALGKKIISATVKAGLLYIELCGVIREGEIAPRAVSELLIPLGFNRQRVSEINWVANASEEKWKAIEAAKIGFKGALDFVRGNEVESVAVLELGQGVVDEGELADESPTGAAGDAPSVSPEQAESDKLQKAEESIILAAARVYHLGALLKLRKKTWAFPSLKVGECSYKLVLSRGACKAEEMKANHTTS